MKNNKKDPWADAAYCHRKAEELRAQLAGLSFAAVVAHAGVNLWRAEAAVLGKQKLSKSLYRKLKGAIGHYQADGGGAPPEPPQNGAADAGHLGHAAGADGGRAGGRALCRL